MKHKTIYVVSYDGDIKVEWSNTSLNRWAHGRSFLWCGGNNCVAFGMTLAKLRLI